MYKKEDVHRSGERGGERGEECDHGEGSRIRKGREMEK